MEPITITDTWNDKITISEGNTFRKGQRVYIAITMNEGNPDEHYADVSLTCVQAFNVVDAILEALKREGEIP